MGIRSSAEIVLESEEQVRIQHIIVERDLLRLRAKEKSLRIQFARVWRTNKSDKSELRLLGWHIKETRRAISEKRASMMRYMTMAKNLERTRDVMTTYDTMDSVSDAIAKVTDVIGEDRQKQASANIVRMENLQGHMDMYALTMSDYDTSLESMQIGDATDGTLDDDELNALIEELVISPPLEEVELQRPVDIPSVRRPPTPRRPLKGILKHRSSSYTSDFPPVPSTPICTRETPAVVDVIATTHTTNGDEKDENGREDEDEDDDEEYDTDHRRSKGKDDDDDDRGPVDPPPSRRKGQEHHHRRPKGNTPMCMNE